MLPGKAEEIIIQGFSGTFESIMKHFYQASAISCRSKESRKEALIKPGNWESSETIIHGTLEDKGFRVFADISVDRKTGQYRFSCGFRGLSWIGFSETRRRHHDVCTGETKETHTASLKVELADFEFTSDEIQGITEDLGRIKGEKVMEYPSPLGGTVRCLWDFESFPCGEETRNP